MKVGRVLSRSSIWLLRITAGVTLLVSVAGLALKSDAAARIAVRRVETAVTAASGRASRVGSLTLSLLPPGARIEDLVVAGMGDSLDDPLARLRDVSVALSIEELLRGRIVVDEVEVDGVEVRYGPGSAREGPPARGNAVEGRPITLRRLNLRNGTLFYQGSRAPFSIEAKDIAVTAASAPCRTRLCLDGASRTGAFRVAYEDHVLTGDALSATFRLDEDLLEVSRFSVTGAGLKGDGSAGWRLHEGAARLVSALRTTGTASEGLLGGLPIRAGTADLTATLALKDSGIKAEGRGTLTEVEYPGLASAPRAEGSFNYSEGLLAVDVTASSVTPRISGPLATGTGSLRARVTRDPEGISAASLQMSPILYKDVFGDVDRRLPVADVTVRAEGTITWRSGDPASLGGSVDLTLEPFAPGGGSPRSQDISGRPVALLSGTLQLEPRQKSIRLGKGRFALPGIDFGLEGVIHRGQGGFDVDVSIASAGIAETLDLLRLMPAATAARGDRLQGIARGRVHVEQGAGGLSAEGSLDGEDLSLRPREDAIGPFHGAATWRYHRRRLIVDESHFTGSDWSADGSVVVDGSKSEVFRSGRLTLRDLPADLFWKGLDLPEISGGAISGRADFDLAASPGSGIAGGEPGISLSLSGARLAGVPLETAHLDAVALGPEVRVRSLRAAGEAGTIEAEGTYSPDSGAGTLDLRAKDLSFEVLTASLAPRGSGNSGVLSLEGRARLSRSGPVFTGTAGLRDLVLRGLPIGAVEGRLEADADGTEARIEAPDLNATGLLRLAAAPGRALEIDLLFQDLALERLQPILPPGTLSALAGKGSGRIWGTVPLGAPIDADLTARITSLTLEAGGTQLGTDGEAEATLREGRIWLGSTKIRGHDTELTLSGVYDLRSASAGAGNASGRFDAGLLKLILPGVEARGSVEIQLHADSEESALVYGGNLRAVLDSLSFPGAPYPLQQVRMVAVAASDGTLRIEDVEFNFAGGEFTGSGTGQLRGIELTRAEIQLHGRNLRMTPLPDLTILFDAELTIHRAGAETRMTGRMDVVRAIYNREFELEASPAFGRTRAAPGERLSSESASPALDINIIAPTDVLVRNNSALLEGSALLRVSGTLARPEITGRISVFDGGSFRFRDVTYRTEGGGIDFDDPDSMDPLLDLTASTQVQAYEITLHVLGRYSSPRFELTSEPTLPIRDIVSLLVSGKTYAETYGLESGAALAAEENVGQYLTAPLTGSIGSTVGRALSLTSVQIEPQFLNGRTDPTARITLTKRISPELLFIYSDSLGTNQEQIYQFQYDLSRAWQILATRNADGTLSSDLRFRHRWGVIQPAKRDVPPSVPGSRAPGEGVASGSLAPELFKGGAEISRIVIEGQPDAKGRLRDSLGLKTGKRYTRGDILEAREKLRAWLVRHSYPLAVVKLTAIAGTAPEGGAVPVELHYDVAAGSKVDTEIHGVRSSRPMKKAVREALDRTIGPSELNRAGSDAILDFLGAKGYASAAVHGSERTEGSAVRIQYEVDRGPKASVRSITFEGTPSVPMKELRKAMGTTEDRWNTSGKLKPPVLKGDLEGIRAVYLSHGYLNVKVGAPTIRFSEDRKKADVVLHVDEGEVWRIGEVTIEGEPLYPASSLRDATLLERGSIVRPSAVTAASERVRDVLDANGYNEVRVKSRIDGTPASANIIFKIDEGPGQVLTSIDILGNSRTASRVILREISLRPGDPISRSGILESQRKLYALGIFRAVDLKVVPSEKTSGRAKLAVTVTEGEPLLTAFGLGYNTEQSLQESVQVGHNNIFGTARSASLFLSHSSRQQRAQINLTDRRLFGIPFEGLVTAFWEKDVRESFDVRRTGGTLQFKHQPTRELTLLGRYTIEDVALSNVDPNIDPNTDLGEQNVRLANVAGSAARDTRNDILNPSTGAFATADARLYLAEIGSTQQFTRLYFSYAWFHSIAARTVFGTSIRVGHERPLGSTSEVPLSERFFAGGDTTLRGFAIDEAGPLDVTTLKPIGGQFSLLLNEELRFPIIGALKGVLFYDLGNVFHDTGDFRWSGTRLLIDVSGSAKLKNGACDVTNGGNCFIQDGFRHVLGTGLRIDTPLGPLRIEYGRKMDRREDSFPFLDPNGMVRFKHRDESPYSFFLSVGQAF